MTKVTDCYKCIHRRNVPGDAHSSCAAPDKRMTGDDHGVRSGWFSYPLNFDPVWRTRECRNFQSRNPHENEAAREALAQQTLNEVADAISIYLGKETAFFLVTVPFGGPGHRARQISNMTKESVFGLLKEYAQNMKTHDDVEKHIPGPAANLMPIYISRSIENPGGETLWLNFVGSHSKAAINLNNLAEAKDGMTGGIISDAIKLYLERDKAGEAKEAEGLKP